MLIASLWTPPAGTLYRLRVVAANLCSGARCERWLTVPQGAFARTNCPRSPQTAWRVYRLAVLPGRDIPYSSVSSRRGCWRPRRGFLAVRDGACGAVAGVLCWRPTCCGGGAATVSCGRRRVRLVSSSRSLISAFGVPQTVPCARYDLALNTGLPGDDNMNASKPTLKQKVWHGIKEYFVISLYLWMIFALFVIYQSVILAQHDIPYAMHGFALLNALALAKVMLVAREFNFADNFKNAPLIVPTLFKSAAFAVVLGCFKILEAIGLVCITGALSARALPRSAAVLSRAYSS